MKQIFLLTLLTLSMFFANAQRHPNAPRPYKWSIGGGYTKNIEVPWMVTAKWYSKDGNSVELIGYNLEDGWRCTIIGAPHFSLGEKGNWRMITGVGFHGGLWTRKYMNKKYDSNPIVGIDAMLGMEYRIRKTPITLQVHAQPNADFIGKTERYKDWAGCAIRYAF